jgi:GNAT superfamily N-acetyltransferase
MAMRIYRKTPGITIHLRRATDEDILEMELQHPDDPALPALSAAESWVLTVGERRDERTVGFIEYFVRESELFVIGLWVVPSARGNGYGTMMIELAEATERPDTILVLASGQIANFYERRGFTRDPELQIMSRASTSL